MRESRFIAAVLVVSLSACHRDGFKSTMLAATCGGHAINVVSDSGIGELVAGRTVETIRSACQVLRDTVQGWHENIPVRMVTVRMGSDSITAVVENDRVDVILVDDPGLRTSDSLGVGTTLGRLLALADLTGVLYEGALHVSSRARCLGFRVRPDGMSVDDIRSSWTNAQLRSLDPASPVIDMTVGGCRAKSRAPSA
jgi:hypothetical protein